MSINLPLVTNRVTRWDALKGAPYIIVSAKGISNGQSTIINDGADFGPDTMLGATSKDQYGPPYTQTAGILEAVNYQQTNGGSIRMTAGRFIISPNALLTQTSSSNILGYPEYAVIPISAQYSLSSFHMLSITGAGGNIFTGGAFVSAPNFDTSQFTIIDVSQLTNLPANASVVLFAYNKLNLPSGTTVQEVIDLHDFGIETATPATAGQNICGGYDFYISVNPNVSGISVYSPNNFFNTVFPAIYVIGQIIDGTAGQTSWVDGLSSYCMYTGFIIGPHIHAGNIITQSCYYGLMPVGDHGADIGRYDTAGCIYPIFASSNVNGSLQINYWDGEDYSAQSGNQEVADIYTSSGNPGTTPFILINNFRMHYVNGTPFPRLPIISNNATAYYSVIVKHIDAQIPSVAGTTAGTVQPTVLEYGVNYSGSLLGYKKMMFVFSGYENDTTTNQTIPYPSNSAPHSNQLTFVTTPVISANNTGLTITPSTTGITITAPNSVTTYSGIIIVEGY